MQDDSNFLRDLPKNVLQDVMGYLEDDDLVSLYVSDKVIAKDVDTYMRLVEHKAFSTILHEQGSLLSERPFDSVTWMELFLDSLACLLWVGDKKSICVAVALVGLKDSKKPKAAPFLLCTGNIAEIAPSKNLKVGDDTLEIIGKNTISGFEKEATAWQLHTSQKSVMKAKNTGLIPKQLATILLGLQLDSVNPPKFRVPKRFYGAGNTRRYCHAELKIVDLLWCGAVVPLEVDENGVGVVYIGVNLLCCQHCFKAIRAFNICSAKIKIRFRGTHGVGYKPVSPTSKDSGWVPPYFIMYDQDIMRAFLLQYEGGSEGFQDTSPSGGNDAIRPKSFKDV